MKLSPERARKLREQGVAVNFASVVRSGKKEQPKQDEPKPVATPQVPTELVKLIESQQEVIKVVSGYGAAVADMMMEMVKPKPKKKYKCVVNRDGRGSINTVDIEEK